MLGDAARFLFRALELIGVSVENHHCRIGLFYGIWFELRKFFFVDAAGAARPRE